MKERPQMTTSPSAPALSKPVPETRIPETTLDYIRTHNRMGLFSLVQNEFRNSGITQTELAVRMGKGTDRICRLLGAPGNWTADTASDLVFAISGGVIKYTVSYPSNEPARNRTRPEWLEPTESKETANENIARQSSVAPPDLQRAYGSRTASQKTDLINAFGHGAQR